MKSQLDGVQNFAWTTSAAMCSLCIIAGCLYPVCFLRSSKSRHFLFHVCICEISDRDQEPVAGKDVFKCGPFSNSIYIYKRIILNQGMGCPSRTRAGAIESKSASSSAFRASSTTASVSPSIWRHHGVAPSRIASSELPLFLDGDPAVLDGGDKELSRSWIFFLARVIRLAETRLVFGDAGQAEDSSAAFPFEDLG